MKIIIANWKLNPQKLGEAIKLVAALGKIRTKNKIVICPPFLYLPLLKTKFALGAQSVSAESHGHFTGEVSAQMLKQFKVKYAIVGHSERRTLGETDQQINAKLKRCLEQQIQPVLCVGFGLNAGLSDEEIFMHLQRQLNSDLAGIDPKKIIVAYEPVWAISNGNPYATKDMPSPEHAERVAMFIRIKFKVAKILYGGSTDAENAASFMDKQIDGLLVGGASLRPAEFVKMISY